VVEECGRGSSKEHQCCLSLGRRAWNPDGVEGAVGVAEENDKEATDVRRCWVVRGVGNLGEVEGECELVLKVSMMCEMVDGRHEVLRVAGDEYADAV
jgi:hypothetical protein